MSVLNAPGNFHGSTMADYGLYGLMEIVFNRDGRHLVVDSAFKVGNAPYLVKSSQVDPIDQEESIVNCQATAIRQLSEWAMRIIQSSFLGLEGPLRYEEDRDCFIVLILMVNLYDFQAEHMGTN